MRRPIESVLIFVAIVFPAAGFAWLLHEQHELNARLNSVLDKLATLEETKFDPVPLRISAAGADNPPPATGGYLPTLRTSNQSSPNKATVTSKALAVSAGDLSLERGTSANLRAYDNLDRWITEN